MDDRTSAQPSALRRAGEGAIHASLTNTDQEIRPMRFIPIILAASLAGSAAAASSESFIDGRVGLEFIPGVNKGDLSNGGPSNDLDKKTGFGVDAGAQYGQYLNHEWGWVAGAALFYQGAKGDFQTGSGDAKFNAYGIEIDAGGAYRLMPELHFELTPFVGVGMSKTEFTGNNDSGSDVFLQYGATVAGYYTYMDHWQGGLRLGWEGYKAKGKADYLGTGSDQTLTLKGSGFLGIVSLGYRF
jgi:hypothetical protein